MQPLQRAMTQWSDRYILVCSVHILTEVACSEGVWMSARVSTAESCSPHSFLIAPTHAGHDCSKLAFCYRVLPACDRRKEQQSFLNLW